MDKKILKSEYNMFAIPNAPLTRTSAAGHGRAHGRVLKADMLVKLQRCVRNNK